MQYASKIRQFYLDWRYVIKEENSRNCNTQLWTLEMLRHRILCNNLYYATEALSHKTWNEGIKQNMKWQYVHDINNTWFEWITRPLMSVYIVGTTCNVYTEAQTSVNSVHNCMHNIQIVRRKLKTTLDAICWSKYSRCFCWFSQLWQDKH